MPLETQWVDIDYMNDYRDFTYNEIDFKGLPGFVQDLHAKNMRFVPIIDAGIAQRENGDYEAYTSGKEQDVFINAYTDSDEYFTGEVWPVDAVYPSFFRKNTTTWWKDQIETFHGLIEFDGLWQDMNEASNFCHGYCYSDQVADTPIKHNLAYTPTGRDLETKSMALDAWHANIEGRDVTELDAHSLFGTMQVKASHEWFKDAGKRAMIIGRSSFAGYGKFGSRWLGDNFSSYKYMSYSVTGVMQQNTFGIPLAGADICGFIGNTTADLCARWYTVGAFYPFSRNHNNLG